MINNKYNYLIEYISQWPDWKINALCLDESDLKIKELIIQYRERKKQVKSPRVSDCCIWLANPRTHVLESKRCSPIFMSRKMNKKQDKYLKLKGI